MSEDLEEVAEAEDAMEAKKIKLVKVKRILMCSRPSIRKPTTSGMILHAIQLVMSIGLQRSPSSAPRVSPIPGILVHSQLTQQSSRPSSRATLWTWVCFDLLFHIYSV